MKCYAITFLALLITTAILSVAFAQAETTGADKKFIEFQKRIDDRSGMLSESDIVKINSALEAQEQAIGLKGYVLILPKIEEWDFDEFARDQFDYWKSKGIVDTKSYIIIISVEDKKYQIVRGGYINSRENDYEINLLRNRMYVDLSNKEVGKAIVNYVNGLGETSTLKKSIEQEKTQKEKGTWYMLIGILILVFVFMRMGYRRRRQYFNLEEKRKSERPFIE
jgi:uncharacterized membrane protein YgcG